MSHLDLSTDDFSNLTTLIVAVLHVQAVSVLNIKALIPVVLDNLLPNYNQWKTLFLNTIVADLHWRSMDYTVRSWLYDTTVSNLIEIATTPSSIACSLWCGLED
jgi:hypothetical protein